MAFVLAVAIYAVTAGWSPVRAQVLLEVRQITCDQFLAFKVADPKDISIWMSGYFHAMRGVSTFDPQRFRDNYAALKTACFTKDNLRRSVFDVAEALFEAQK